MPGYGGPWTCDCDTRSELVPAAKPGLAEELCRVKMWQKAVVGVKENFLKPSTKEDKNLALETNWWEFLLFMAAEAAPAGAYFAVMVESKSLEKAKLFHFEFVSSILTADAFMAALFHFPQLMVDEVRHSSSTIVITLF